MKKVITFFLGLGLLLTIGLTLCWSWLPKPNLLDEIHFSRAIYDENSQLLRLNLTADEKFRLWTPLDQMSSEMIQATLLKEDEYFYSHQGINFSAIAAAFWQTYIIQGHRRGASTITMQVARLRYNINTHTLSGKVRQMILALMMEHYYSKQQILEAYLNLAPYGNNIEGVGAASLIYYHQHPKTLTLPQVLTLSVIPQNPGKRSLDNQRYQWIENARLNLYQRWLALYPQDKKWHSLIHLPLVNETREQLPFHAPHFVTYILQQKTMAAHSSITTTLDLSLQKILEKNLSADIARKHHLGIHNAAALLVDTSDMAVKALVGSADFFNPAIAGEVNGVMAKRSPGSTLKPFIYGLAIDQGLIHPATVLKDSPLHLGAYTPDNFDYDFLGPISAQAALTLSRNIPAVYLATQLQQPTFYDFLWQSGMPLRKESDYGLALVLGGAEISMQHLTALYAMLANQGVYTPLRFTKEQELPAGKRLLSAEASFLVLDMLQHTPKPNVMNAPNHTVDVPVAWKTGTSSGYRDAWAVGVFDHYVLAVWVGNFSGKGDPALTGRDAAAPLFFKLMAALLPQLPINKQPDESWRQLNLTKVEVCVASGMLPTHACPQTILSWFIPGKSPIQKDTVFREVMINGQTGLRTCQVDPKNKIEVFEFWPSDLLKIFQQAGIQRRAPPPYEKNCQMKDKIMQGLIPHIISPKKSVNYVVNTAKREKIPLNAVVDADVDQIHWFVNAHYLGKVSRQQTLWWLAEPGQYTIRVVDDYGRSDAVDILVKSHAARMTGMMTKK